MAKALKDVRSCRVCGCTDADCSGCVTRTGVACHWVSADLCSACAAGWGGLIRVKRGNTNLATVRVGGKMLRASSTCSEIAACEALAQKAAAAVCASEWRVQRYRSLSLMAGKATLRLGFGVLLSSFKQEVARG
jgi:hypothetical protein